MASPLVGPSSFKSADLKDLQRSLYTRCRTQFPGDKLLFQQDLLKLNVIPDNSLEVLVQCAQALTNQNLFKVHTVNDRIAWKVVKEEDAAKYESLSIDERMIYSVIDSSGTTGIWTKHIKFRTNLHQTILTRCLKSLETKSLVKTVRNVKHPSQKIYMVFGLQPSEDVTGGAWFTDGVLDEVFIQHLGTWVVKWVASKSWFASSAVTTSKPAVASPNKKAEIGEKRKNIENPTEDVKGKAHEIEGGGVGGGKRHQHTRGKGPTVYLPYPPGYTNFPTASDVTRAVNESGLIDVEMNQATTQQLLDVLCFDGKLVRVRNGRAYKSVRTPGNLRVGDEGDALTEAPCGRCPVFSLCNEDGPINARNCEYFQGWLEIL